ncbi:unnamed protein product [Closterium sp. NIES-54]
MDPTVGHDPVLKGTTESAQQEQEPADPRPRVPARPSASEPFCRFERGLSLPLRGVPRPTSPEYSWAPDRVASNRLAGQPDQGCGRSPRRQPPLQRSPRRRSPERREPLRNWSGRPAISNAPSLPPSPLSSHHPVARGGQNRRSLRARC